MRLLEENVKNIMNSKTDRQAGQTRSLVNRITKRQTAFINDLMRREGFRTPYHYGKTGRKTRQRETERTKKDGHSFCMNVHRGGNVCNFGDQELRRLAEHDCQHHEGSHLMINLPNKTMSLQKTFPPRNTRTISYSALYLDDIEEFVVF